MEKNNIEGDKAGWNRSRQTNHATALKDNSRWHGIIAGLIVVVIVGAALKFAYHRVQGAKDSLPVSLEKGAATVLTAKQDEEGITKIAQDKKDTVESTKAITMENAPILSPEKVDGDGTNSVEEFKQPYKVKRAFTNALDQLLSMVLPREPGDSVPPLPVSLDDEFSEEQEAQLFNQLAVEDDDTDEVIDRKELVQSLRNEFAMLKKERGWRFVDYIKALEAKANLDSEVLSESIKINETVFNDPQISDDKYLETLTELNKVLESRGIKPIKVPGAEDQEE